MTEQEKTLIAGCLAGDKAAWDAFVLQYSPLVYHTIKRTFSVYHTELGADRIEDLYQEFFLSLLRDDYKKLRQFRGDHGCTLASWLRVIATRLTIDFLRKQVTVQVEPRDMATRDALESFNSLINEEQEKLLARALLTLPPRDHILIDLCFRQSLPPEEIALILKTSVGAFYTQKSRVLDKIREILRA